jgi:hypothetical protein
MCLRTSIDYRLSVWRVTSVLIPLAVVLQFFRFGFWQSDYSGYSSDYLTFIYSGKIIELYNYLSSKSGNVAFDILFFIYFWGLRLLTYAGIPLLLVALPVGFVGYVLNLKLDYRALSARLWRIVASVALIFVINIAALWIEEQTPLRQILEWRS